VRYILINIGLYSYLLTTVRAPRDSIRTPSSVTYSTPKVFTPVGPHDFDQSDEYISATATAEECMAWEPSLEPADIHVTYHGVDQPGRVYLTRGFDTLPPTSSRDILAPKRGHYCQVCGHNTVNIKRHNRERHVESRLVKFDCPHPGCFRQGTNGFVRAHNLKIHRRTVHCHAI